MKISFSFLLFGKQPLTLVTFPRCVAMLILWKSMLVSNLLPVASVILAPTSSMNLQNKILVFGIRVVQIQFMYLLLGVRKRTDQINT